jgi:hypothetical protein
MTTAKATTAKAKLSFNRADTLRFITALENTYQDSWNFRCIPESEHCRAKISKIFKDGRQCPRMSFRGSFVEHEAMLRKRNGQGFAIFYSLNLMEKAGVKAKHCYTVRAIPLDLDKSPLPDEWASGIKPHIVVETSPGRYQCLFRVFLCESFEMDAAQDVGRRLAAYYDGDPSVADRARILRLPGFVHQKGKPFTSRLVSGQEQRCPSDGCFPDYTLEDFAFLPKLPKRQRPSSRGVGAIGPKAAKLLFEHYPVHALQGNEAWQTFAMALHAACDGDEDVAEMFFEWCLTDSNYANDQADVWNRLRWNSFTADKPGGVGIGTLHKLCRDVMNPETDEPAIPGDVRFAIFNNAAKDFE